MSAWHAAMKKLIPALVGLYALSGAGVIRRLPLLRTILLVVGSLFFLRGLFIIMTVMVVLGIRPGEVWPMAVASHLVFLAAAAAFLGGAILNWKRLKTC